MCIHGVHDVYSIDMNLIPSSAMESASRLPLLLLEHAVALAVGTISGRSAIQLSLHVCQGQSRSRHYHGGKSILYGLNVEENYIRLLVGSNLPHEKNKYDKNKYLR